MLDRPADHLGMINHFIERYWQRTVVTLHDHRHAVADQNALDARRIDQPRALLFVKMIGQSRADPRPSLDDHPVLIVRVLQHASGRCPLDHALVFVRLTFPLALPGDRAPFLEIGNDVRSEHVLLDLLRVDQRIPDVGRRRVDGRRCCGCQIFFHEPRSIHFPYPMMERSSGVKSAEAMETQPSPVMLSVLLAYATQATEAPPESVMSNTTVSAP